MAYAVLVSLFNSTHKMLNPYPLIIPCNKQTIQSLHENIDSLISFLDNTPPHKYQTTKSLEANIIDVGYKAEDVLESYVSKHSRSIYRIRKTVESEGDDVNDANDIEDDGTDEVDLNDANDSEYDSNDGNDYSKYEAYELVETDDRDDENDENDHVIIMLSESLVEIIKGFESLIEQMKDLIQTNHVILATDLPVNQMSSLSIAASSDNTLSAKNKFVLLDKDMMNEMKEQLFYGGKQLKVIPLVGMGGIGKTTLAKALIDDPFTSSHFDVRGWVTVSQQYSIQDVVENLLKDITGEDMRNESLSQSKVQLHKALFKRRYVVVLDDLWDIEACDELQRLFPDCNNGSRIMVTTRQSGVATFAAKSYHEMKLLNGNMSWDLLRQVVFGAQEGNKECPQEFIKIGREIAKKCKGLPLTISVIGGLLSKEKMTTLQHWEQFSENMKSTLTAEGGDECLEILSLSFNHLPHHLKACFLYFGIYPEDQEIRVSDVLELWVAEGFLKAYPTNYMKKVAEENLKELIERNLILVERVEYNGNPRYIKIHDLVRDLCIREAGKEKFLYVLQKDMDFIGEEARGHRRLSILRSFTSREFDIVIQLIPGIRSLICFEKYDNKEQTNTFGCELLRVIYMPFDKRVMEGELSSNLRYLYTSNTVNVNSMIFKMWDLQYLNFFQDQKYLLPQCIWYMPQLRHVWIHRSELPPLPPIPERPICVLERLESLSLIQDFRCDDEVLVRIPNLRELIIWYEKRDQALDWSYYRLNNLVKLTKLETLHCRFVEYGSAETLLANLAFPLSLKELSLAGCKISWEHMDIIGVLPNLEVLNLSEDAFVGDTWETSENHFKKLEYLMIFWSSYLQEWIVEDANHFPSLRYLNLWGCGELEEIPTSIGEIATLETIELYECSEGVVSSAMNIQDEINIDLKLIIDLKTRRA